MKLVFVQTCKLNLNCVQFELKYFAWYSEFIKNYIADSLILKLVCNDGGTIVFILSGTIEDTLSK